MKSHYPEIPPTPTPGRYQLMVVSWMGSLNKWSWWTLVGTTDDPNDAMAMARFDARAVRNDPSWSTDDIRVYRLFDRHGWYQFQEDIIL